mmetsp:Transcript_3118/g.12837  ORF Transcript_3118/g.12837 Transcript_3118/m.12837 type:complete len:278 (+) Transcript_3118:1659-2492(+)
MCRWRRSVSPPALGHAPCSPRCAATQASFGQGSMHRNTCSRCLLPGQSVGAAPAARRGNARVLAAAVLPLLVPGRAAVLRVLLPRRLLGRRVKLALHHRVARHAHPEVQRAGLGPKLPKGGLDPDQGRLVRHAAAVLVHPRLGVLQVVGHLPDFARQGGHRAGALAVLALQLRGASLRLLVLAQQPRERGVQEPLLVRHAGQGGRHLRIHGRQTAGRVGAERGDGLVMAARLLQVGSPLPPRGRGASAEAGSHALHLLLPHGAVHGGPPAALVLRRA